MHIKRKAKEGLNENEIQLTVNIVFAYFQLKFHFKEIHFEGALHRDSYFKRGNAFFGFVVAAFFSSIRSNY